MMPLHWNLLPHCPVNDNGPARFADPLNDSVMQKTHWTLWGWLLVSLLALAALVSCGGQ